jgi:hypothetical protein
MDALKASISQEKPENLAEMWMRDDNVEVFLNPNLGRRSYIQVMVNPLGVAHDMKAGMSRAGDPRIDFPVEVRAHREPKAWSVEIAVPFCGLGYGTGIGPIWGINICRYEQRLKEMTQWSPTNDYHQPKQFGLVTVPADLSHLVDLKDVSPGQELAGTNTFAASVRHSMDQPRRMETKLEVVPETGETRSFTAEDLLRPHEWTALRLDYEVGKGTYGVRLTMTDTKTGRKCFQRVLGPFSTRRPVELKLIEPWYRDTIYASTPISAVVCEVRINLDASELRQTALEVALADATGRAVGNVKKRPKAGVHTLSFPAKSLSYSEYSIRAVVRKNEEVVAEAACGLRKLPPFPNEVVLDRERRLLIAGKPYFPVGMWGGFAGTPEMADAEKEAAESGFTCYALGKPRFAEPSRHPLRLKDEDFGTLQRAPLLLGWYTHDEPEIHGPTASPEALRKELLAAVEKDPYHPVCIVHCPIGLEAYNDYAGCQDVVMADIYTQFRAGGGPTDPDFLKVLAFWLKAARDASGGREPVIAVLPNYGSQVVGDSGPFDPDARVATLREQRAMAYTSVISGARGILWFLYYSGSPWYARYTPNVPRSWDALKALVGELNHLFPALLAPDQPSGLEVESSGSPIYATLRKPNHDFCLIAVNPEPETLEVRFRIKGFRPSWLSVLSESRRVKARGGGFSDTFKPYEAHIYTTGEDPNLEIAKFLADEWSVYRYTAEEAFTLKHDLALKRNGADAQATSSTPPYFIFGPITAIDGNPMTRWTPLTTDANPTLTVRLADRRTIDRVVVKSWAKNGSYVVECLAGQEWKAIAESKTGPAEHRFGPVRTESVRLRVVSKAAMAVNEFEVYGEGEMVSPKYWPWALREQEHK